MKAVRVHEPGGPGVLLLEDVAPPEPATDEVLIRVCVAGVNYADIGLRRGMFHSDRGHGERYPLVPGFEVADTIAALGEGVEGLSEGDRVAAVIDNGGYAEYAAAPADSVVRIPEGVDYVSASALLVQGITAYGVLHDSARLQPGESVLVMAAAGGVGSLAVQLAQLAGAGIVVCAGGGSEKLELARSLGASVVVN